MIETKTHFVQAVRERVGEVVVGQDVVVERMMIALLTGGHLLLLGVPGTAKTLLVNAVARAVDLKFSRVQFTIDMLPSDIIGSELLDQTTGKFRTHQGPVFTNLLLADEINRAAPKVQSALLEAMQERKVTIGNYPTATQEEEVLRRQLKMGLKRVEGGAMPKTAFDMIGGEPVCHLADLVGAMEKVQEVHVSEVFMKHTIEFVRLTRSHPSIELGCSPRAGLAIVQAARARAYVLERDYVVPEDLFELAEDVVLHRMRLSYEALAEGQKPTQVLEELLQKLG